jgi:ABC-type transporter Mla subunit MlaD
VSADAHHTAEHAGMDRLRLEVKRASGPFLLFALLVIVGLATAADIMRNLAGDKPWVGYKPYRVAFRDTKGVVPSRAELRLAGVKAGSIKKSQLVNGQAVLTINLEKKYAPLYRDARVRIRPVTPLEDMYVDIESRGHKAAGELKGDQILGAQHTISPVEIGTVLDQLDKGTRANMASLLDQLDTGLRDGGTNLRWAFTEMSPFFRSARELSRALAGRRENLARLVHNFGGVADELATHDRQLASFVKGADGTLGQLARDDAPFQGTLAQLPGTLKALQSSFANLRATEDTLDPALRSLQPVAGSLPEGLDALSEFSTAATPALRALRPSAKSLRPLARSLRPTSQSLSSAFTLLRKEAPQIDDFTHKTEPCLGDASLLLNRAMSFTKFGDEKSRGGGSVADARADVRVDFTTAGQSVKDPSWTVKTPCNMKGGK